MRKLKSTVFLVALLSLSVTPANAQGGVWKGFKSGVRSAVDKGVKKSVEDVIDASAGMVGANKGNPKPGSGNSGGNGSGNGRYVSKHKECDPGPQPSGAGAWTPLPKVKAEVGEFRWLCVTDSYDGVFGIPDQQTRKWQFYRTDGGKPIDGKKWRAADEPHFNKGVCAVQDPDSKQWFVLNKDGRTIPLAKNITKVTNFMDGVAIASTVSYNHFFINDKGQKVFPAAVPDKDEIYPLIDGNRRLFYGKGGYGYMDARGTVVIKPQYEEARNFSSGVTVVFGYTATQDKFWLIDVQGKKVCEVPEQYAKVGWTKMCNVGDFVASATVAKNNSTGKYDIIGTDMKVKASFDYASPFCQLKTPVHASVCVVKNDDWKYPKFCNIHGKLLDYGNPPQPGTPPTEPWYETSNAKGEKIVRKPFIEGEMVSAKQAWSASRWEYSGMCFSESGSTDTGYVMNYEGLMRLFDRKYESPDNYSIDGYAKCIKRSTAGWRVVGCTWVEDLEEHTVFIDRNGKVMVEVVAEKKEL